MAVERWRVVFDFTHSATCSLRCRSILGGSPTLGVMFGRGKPERRGSDLMQPI